MAAEDAGSVYSEVRIRLDKLASDINQAVSVMDRFGQKVVDTGNIASNLFSNSYSKSLKQVEGYVKSLDKAVTDGALTQRQAIQSALEARKAELAYIQATAAKKGGFTDQEINDLKRVKGQITTLTAEQKKLGDETAKSAGGFKALGLAASTAIIATFRAMTVETLAYSSALAGVRAASRGTSEELAQLAAAAESAGKDLAVSSTEALKAEEALIKAGVSVADVMAGALPGALTLAAAGTMEVADAAEIAAATMTQFGLGGKDVTHIADLLAAGAGKAQGEVSDLSQALKQAGLVASQTGLSVDDTVGSLAAFASAGLLGSDAGTSFRTMLLRLTPQSKEASEKMAQLGLNAFDAKGEFIGITAFAGQLQKQLKGLTTEQRNSALATIFGSDSIRAANVLYTQGAKGIGEWIGKVNDSGFAAETARIKLDSLSGDLQKLNAQASTTAAKIGDSLNPVMRGLAQAGTAVLDFIDDISSPWAAFITATLGLGSAIAAVTLGVGFLTPALAALGITVSAAFGPISLVVGAIAALTGGIIAMTAAVDKANIEKAGKAFGDIAVNSGLAGEELAKFNKRASDAEMFLGSLSQEGISSSKAFEQLAKDMGLTNDQLAQIALRSNRASAEVKETARKYLDGAAAAKRFAEANMALGLTLRDSWRKGTPEEIKKIEEALKNLGDTASVVADSPEFTDSELEEFANRYKATADRVSDIVNFMRADQTRNETERASEIEATNQTIIDSYAYSQARIRDIIEQRMHGTADDQLKETRRTLEANIDLADSILGVFNNLASALSDLFSALYSRQVEEATAAYSRERELIENNGLTRKEALTKSRDEALASGDAVAAADAQKALDLYNLEVEFTRKKAKLEYEAAMSAWAIQVAMTIAQAAQATLNAYSSTSAIPIVGPGLAPFAAGAAAAVGALQLGAVIAAQPQPPKFHTGGIFPGGPNGAVEGPAILKKNEMTLTEEQQANLFAMANGVGSGGGGVREITIPITLLVDGTKITQIVVKHIDGGDVPMKSLKR